MRASQRVLVLGATLVCVFALVACGSSGASSSSDFTLSPSATTVSVAPGATANLSVTVNSAAASSSTIGVTVTGLPAGITASPSTFNLTTGGKQQITFTASANAAAGNAALTFTGTSGSRSHSATVSLTVTAPPPPVDFSLSATPTTATLNPGATTQITLTPTSANGGFTGSVMVAISGLPAGVTASPATLTLTTGFSQNVVLSAAPTAALGPATITFTGTESAFTHTATVALTVITPAAPAVDVTTYHYDNSRQGLNAQETILTLANVNATKFGKLAIYPVDGKVDAQPLYVSGLALPAGATNVLYVATEHDSVYALNAATGAQIWKTSLLAANETTSDIRNCGQIAPEIGITATPVIDRTHGANGTLFVVGMTKDASGGYHQRLHALDLASGAELTASPTEVQASYPGTGAGSRNGSVIFDPAQYAERASLLLLNGNIYTAWTSHCDSPPYTGWVIGYSESTLLQSAVLNLTPNGSEGSVWMSGYGLAADTSGNIYLLTANGTFDGALDANGFPGQSDYGNTMLKLSTAGGKLVVSDYFAPFDTVAQSNSDIDLGSGGAMLLPDFIDKAGAARHLLMGAGKNGHIYVADRGNLGKFNQRTADNSNLYQEILNGPSGGAWSGPAYFNGTVYYAGVGDVLKGFPITNALLSATAATKSATAFAYPGATPSVSSNGTQSGIVWALESNAGAAAVLHAYDASNLATELYNSNQAASGRDSFGNGNKFITPVVVDGHVYVGTPTGVVVFGELNPTP